MIIYNSEDPSIQTVSIWNPLVVMLGISYHKKQNNSVLEEYKNVIATFAEVWNYSIYFKTNDNKNRYITKDSNYAQYSRRFKLNWSYNEIYSFNNDIRKQIEAANHDALFYIISAHCNGRSSIVYDSHLKKIHLSAIYEHFHGKQCKFLCENPKVFFLNAQFNSKTDALITKKKKKRLKFMDPKGKSKIKDENRLGDMKDDESDNEHAFMSYSPAGFQKASTMMNLMLSEQHCRYIIGNFDRNKYKGSAYLIEALKSVMKDRKEEDFTKIIQKVSNKVNEMVGNNDKEVEYVIDTNVFTYVLNLQPKANLTANFDEE